MFPNLNPKRMQAVMKQLGMSQNEIDASRVIIEKPDNSKIIINDPSVTKIKMQNQESFQITGEIEEEKENFSENDIEVVMQKTNCSREKAEETLKETQDLAEAILKLS